MNSEFRQPLAKVASRYAVCSRELERIGEPSSFDHKAQERFPAASVVKAGIMSALLLDVAQGRCSLDDLVEIPSEWVVGGAGVLFEMDAGRSYSLRELCKLMMVVSDNTASNACLRQVGMERLNEFFGARGYQATVQRFFMNPVVNGRDNTMTAESAALMLGDLYLGRDLPDELRDFAVACLRGQQYREKIPLMLPEDLVVGHKTGELDGVRHDAAVIEAEKPYALVVLTAEGGAPWLVDRAMAECSLQIFKMRTGVESEVCS